MRIAVYHNLLVGGAKRVVYEEVKKLRRKHELFLFRLKETDESLWDIRPFMKKVFDYSFDINRYKTILLKRLEKDFNNFFLLNRLHRRIAEDINKSKCDVCLLHPDIYTQSPYLLRYLSVPSVYYCHELLRIAYEKELKISKDIFIANMFYENATRKIRKSIDKSNARHADKIIANSQFTAEKVSSAYNKRATVYSPGVDINIFKPYKNKKSNFVSFIGRSKDKIDGYDIAFESVNRVKRKNLKLYSLFPKKEKLRLADKDLAKKYSESLLTLCTSMNEPFGLTAIESMACETPVLAVNEGGYKETVIDGVTGYLLPRYPKAFADKIKYLMDNPDIARKMGKAGREHVKKNFTWERHNKQLEKILLKYASKKKK